MNWKIIFIPLLLLACERPEPQFVLKSEVGESTIPIWEDLADDPKFIKVKKSDIDKQRELEKHRADRRERKGVYQKTNPWDF